MNPVVVSLEPKRDDKWRIIMAFTSEAVSIEWNRNNLILKRGASTLVINAENVQSLRTQDSENEFNSFFRSKALQNREARRVFEAWERKDKELLAKLYKEMST
jgi:hypothetical protein